MKVSEKMWLQKSDDIRPQGMMKKHVFTTIKKYKFTSCSACHTAKIIIVVEAIKG